MREVLLGDTQELWAQRPAREVAAAWSTRPQPSTSWTECQGQQTTWHEAELSAPVILRADWGTRPLLQARLISLDLHDHKLQSHRGKAPHQACGHRPHGSRSPALFCYDSPHHLHSHIQVATLINQEISMRSITSTPSQEH